MVSLPAWVWVSLLVVPGGVGRVSVQEPEHEGGDHQGGQDRHPHLHTQHFHELEQRAGADGFPFPRKKYIHRWGIIISSK